MSVAPDSLEAWIDVGGTFTDCYLRDRAGLKRCKILSTGRVPISLASRVGPQRFKVPELEQDARHFWCGAELRVYTADGTQRQRLLVTEFSDGILTLASDLDELAQSVAFELDARLEAPVLGVRRLLGCGLHERLPPISARLGTTKGTNALLTRTGAKTALAVTSPFEDLLTIGDQTRPDIFALDIEKGLPLAGLTIGIRERLDAAGTILHPLDVQHATEQLRFARQRGCESLAICLMHAYLNPQHEQQLLGLAQEFGFDYVGCSSHLAPLIEIVARAQTTVVDAYLSPVVHSYLARLVDQLGGQDQVKLLVMTSAGGLVEWREYFGKDSILSGPAGGVAALRALASASERPGLIGLDMGGTSTDVCRAGSEESLQYESTKAGVRVLTPTLPIETVAAGGGSICWFDGVCLRVGPNSAGALPGPACYGRGGPLTITDLNVFLGRVPAEQFPFPIDALAIEQRLSQLAAEIEECLGKFSLEELATGFRRLANEQMAAAVRTVSIAQGVDPRDHALVGFGGAAGQHICEIADELGIQTILDAVDAGLLSALGMGLADLRLDAVVSIYREIDDCDWPNIDNEVERASQQLRSQLEQQIRATERPGTPSGIEETRLLELRYAGTDVSMTLGCANRESIKTEFDALHRARYGYDQPRRPVELVSVRLQCTLAAGHAWPRAKSILDPLVSSNATIASTPILERASREDSHRAGQLPAASRQSIARQSLRPGDCIAGPRIVANEGSTLVVEENWVGEVLSDGTLELRRNATSLSLTITGTESLGGGPASATEFDPVFRDCFAQRLSAIATQMGLVLQQTAISVNVKRRRDFSCAVFDDRGQLLASAPHVPVHLGAMGVTVRAVQREFPWIEAGDCFITNDPFCGGSHLPDITVISPVFAPAANSPTFFVANRAHHADIGGIAPGSMSVSATRLAEEGVLIPPCKLVSAGHDRSDAVAQLLRSARWPPRKLSENMADISAQQAANARGAQLLADYAASTSWETLAKYGRHLLDAAESRVKLFIEHSLEPLAASGREFAFTDSLDDGTPIAVHLTFPGGGIVQIDFSGTGTVSPTNFNANPSIVTAAVMYVLRCLIADELPLNEGVLRCVRLMIPPGLLDPPNLADGGELPAVAAGNVETSQRLVDVLLGALGAAAASQGTMNNLLFGNSQFGFYETICGGAGATPRRAGASGVHTHMTNTRLTDPEVLEARYPVRLLEFGIRHGSGGKGRWAGGDGVRRTLEFLDDVELSLLTSRRGSHQPFGLAGGGPGAAGRNRLYPTNAPAFDLPACCQLSLLAGTRLQLETPGGGAYGPIAD